MFCFPGDSLARAAELVRKAGGGPVPVLRDGSTRRFLGVVSEGQWMSRSRRDTSLRVRDVMTLPAVICRRGDDFTDVVPRMERHGLTRVPVLNNDGSLAGMFVHPRHRQGLGAGLLLSAAAFAIGALVMLLFEPSPAVQAELPETAERRPIRRRGKTRRGELSLTATALGGGLAMYAARGRGSLAKATAMLGMGMLARGLTHAKGDES